MSIVERALKRIQANSDRPQRRDSSEERKPIARVTSAKAQSPAQPSESSWDFLTKEDDSRPRIEFDLEMLGRAGFYSAGNNRLADEYRMIKQPIVRKAGQAANLQDNGRENLLMVTSALPGEGKTFSSVNLALSLAREKDWNILLVDADCRNPQLCRLLGTSDQAGLLDVLRDPSLELESHVMPTNIDSLFVLPVGTVDENSTELLASERMSQLCEQLATSIGRWLVLFDTSPLLLTTESVILSDQVGQIALVVRANKTPQSAVLEAIGKLNQNKAIGLILNRADQGGEALAYGSYQAYGYPAR
jgi:protein-tyrosine kinase